MKSDRSPNRTITPQPDGSVLVVSHFTAGHTLTRSYSEVDRVVYVQMALEPGMPSQAPIGGFGQPFMLRDGESLESAVRRMFDEPAKSSGSVGWIGWAVVAVVLVAVAAVYFLSQPYNILR